MIKGPIFDCCKQSLTRLCLPSIQPSFFPSFHPSIHLTFLHEKCATGHLLHKFAHILYKSQDRGGPFFSTAILNPAFSSIHTLTHPSIQCPIFLHKKGVTGQLLYKFSHTLCKSQDRPRPGWTMRNFSSLFFCKLNLLYLYWYFN